MIAQLQSYQPAAEGGRVEVDDNSTEALQARASVKLWQSRITSARKKWEPDFKRMRKNMEFVTGLQWAGQAEMDEERYVNNLTLRIVNQKVATLYAKNPKAVATRRDRLDFQIWDENVESLMNGIQQASQMTQSGQPLPIELSALFADYQQGYQRRKLVEKVCRTMEVVYQYQVDTQQPEFKEQMKQAVRRVITCGVAYARPIFCTDESQYTDVSTIDTKSGIHDRMNRVKAIVQQIKNDDIDETSPQFETLRSLMLSISASNVLQNEFQLPQRLEFDFPPSTSILIDERCRNLHDFVAARWLAQEYILPVQEVNGIFNVDVKVGTGATDRAKEYTQEGDSTKELVSRDQSQTDPLAKKHVALLEVFDYSTKTRFFLVDGHKDYILPPELVTPNVSGFWHHIALVFNGIEIEPGTKASIFPPSDVQTLKSVQKEWNRTREALRDHRNANAPKYLVRKGFLTDDDKAKLRNAVPNEVIELEGVPPEQPIEKFIIPMQFAEIDPRLYDTAPLEQDMMLGAGTQQANIGPAQPNVTATVGTIAEQSRLNVSASNIDDLDGFLSRLAQAGGEMLLQNMSSQIVKRIAGPGAVWPDLPQSRQDFLNEVYLKIEAASSGRPNKAIEIQNFQQLAPIMLQAGANP